MQDDSSVLSLLIVSHFCRLFLRVDDVVVKLRETRFFHAFLPEGANVTEITIHMVVTWRELNVSVPSAVTSSLPLSSLPTSTSKMSFSRPTPPTATTPAGSD